MSHSGCALVWHVQPRVVIFPCRTHYRPSSVKCQQPTTQFFTGQMPFLPPNQQRQSTEGSSTASQIAVNSLLPPYSNECFPDEQDLPGSLVGFQFHLFCSRTLGIRRRDFLLAGGYPSYLLCQRTDGNDWIHPFSSSVRLLIRGNAQFMPALRNIFTVNAKSHCCRKHLSMSLFHCLRRRQSADKLFLQINI